MTCVCDNCISSNFVSQSFSRYLSDNARHPRRTRHHVNAGSNLLVMAYPIIKMQPQLSSRYSVKQELIADDVNVRPTTCLQLDRVYKSLNHSQQLMSFHVLSCWLIFSLDRMRTRTR